MRYRSLRPCSHHAAWLRGSIGILLLTLLALSTGAHHSSASPPLRSTGLAGAGSTGIDIVNFGQFLPAEILVDFYDQRGRAPVGIARHDVPAGAFARIYLPDEPDLTFGAYAVAVAADRRVRALARTEWQVSSGAAVYRGATPAREIVLPLVARSWQGQSSLITVQNTDLEDSTAFRVELHVPDGSGVVAGQDFTVGPGTSTTLDLGSTTSFEDLPEGFRGWARIQAANPVVVSALVNLEDGAMGIYSVDGEPASAGSNTLWAPLVYTDDAGSGLHSDITVLNAGSDSVAVGVTYTGLAGSCAEREYYSPPVDVAAGAVAIFSQQLGRNAAALPAGCVASARISASGGPIHGAVRVLDGDPDGGQARAAGYATLARTSAGLGAVLPHWRKDFLGLSTQIGLVNVGGVEAHIQLELFDLQGGALPCAGGRCQQVLAPGAAARWSLDEMVSVGDSSLGSAALLADQPLVVVSLEAPAAGGEPRQDLTAGPGLTEHSPGPRTGSDGDGTDWLPVALYGESAVGAFRTPSAGSTATEPAPVTDTPRPSSSPGSSATPNPASSAPVYLPRLAKP